MMRDEFDSSSDEEGSTSSSIPCDTFRIDWLTIPGVINKRPRLAISALPGCRFRAVWRNLEVDITTVQKAVITDVFVLLTNGELMKYRVPRLLSAYADAGICVHHWPFEDGTVPEVDDLMHMIYDLKMALQWESNVLIHCYGGLGRACFVAGCLMLDLNEKLSPEDVVETLRRLRGPGAIQTVKQYNFIMEYREKRDHYLKTSPRSLSR
ncbi:Cyclin-dependent kinase inhibitor 3 [Chamberlinius hualienensis]